MRRCTKCVLPETIPNIKFDEAGVCNYCREYENQKTKQIDFENRIGLFDAILKKTRDERVRDGGKYDVLIPLSGGRDSSYVAWKLSKDFKVLCVNYENPFSSDQAKRNITNLVEKLNLDLHTFQYPNQRHEKSFSSNLRAWMKKPKLATTGLLCLACKPMYLEFYRIARRNNIRLIVDGSNLNEVATFKMEAQGGAGAKKLLSAKTIFNLGKEVFGNLSYIRPCNVLPAVNTLLSINGQTPYLRWRYPEIQKMGYFYNHPYHEEAITQIIRNFGWEKASDNKSPWRFDCEIDSLKNYLFQKIVGATEKDDLFSKNIRAGLMTREEALKRLEEGDVNVEIVERVLEKVGLKKVDLDSIESRYRKGKSRVGA